MKYEKLEGLSAESFRRITGVKGSTFVTMARIVRAADAARLRGVGRPATLSAEDQLLMTLEYLREYRTYAHMGIDYGVGESSAFRIIRRVENALVRSKTFALPKRAAALSDRSIIKETIDCTESPIERPQKNSTGTTRERKRDIRSKRR